MITGELAFRYVTYFLRYASWTHSSCTYSCRTSERYRQEMPSPKSGGQTVLDETELQARISVCRGCDERVRPLFEDARSLQSLCKLVITCTMRLGAERIATFGSGSSICGKCCSSWQRNHQPRLPTYIGRASSNYLFQVATRWIKQRIQLEMRTLEPRYSSQVSTSSPQR